MVSASNLYSDSHSQSIRNNFKENNEDFSSFYHTILDILSPLVFSGILLLCSFSNRAHKRTRSLQKRHSSTRCHPAGAVSLYVRAAMHDTPNTTSKASGRRGCCGVVFLCGVRHQGNASVYPQYMSSGFMSAFVGGDGGSSSIMWVSPESTAGTAAPASTWSS